MTSKKKLSIIIVNYHTYLFLSRSLDSIYRSRMDLNLFEIIVVDNASYDKSLSLIHTNYPEVLTISNEKNIGFAAANNQAVTKSCGDYILFLNPDTLIQSNTLDKMIDYIDKHPKVGVATCEVRLPSGILDDACHRGFPAPWNAFCQFTGLAAVFPKSTIFNGYHLGYQNMDKIHEIDSCTGAFMLVRRKVGDTIGWFDEEYYWYGEDVDFCYRVKKLNWKIMYIPFVQIIHYKGVASGIKKHSQDVSSADLTTKLQATYARFQVMRVFYNKHYHDKYPSWVRLLIMTGIKLKEKISLMGLYK